MSWKDALVEKFEDELEDLYTIKKPTEYEKTYTSV